MPLPSSQSEVAWPLNSSRHSLAAQGAHGAWWEVCSSTCNLLASASADSLLAPPAPSPHPRTKGQKCVLFSRNLTYTTYRNLHRLDRFCLGLFEHLYLASNKLRFKDMLFVSRSCFVFLAKQSSTNWSVISRILLRNIPKDRCSSSGSSI